MALSYLGNTTFTECEEPTGGVDLYDLDTMSRKFEGAAPLFPAFIRSFKKAQPDVDFPQLSFSTYTFSGSQGVITVILNFVGKYDENTLSRSKPPEYDTRLQQATFTGFASGIQLNVIYKSPMVRTMWSSKIRPKDSAAFQNLPDKECKIVTVIGANQVELANFGDSMDKILSGPEFNVKAVNERTSFPRVPAGKWWRNTETVERKLVQQSNTIIL